MQRSIDLNSDLGESFGAWRMGEDAALMDIVTSANVACGGHAGDADTMVKTLLLAKARGVSVGAHPGYADLAGFGRRVIPMSAEAIERMVATQVGALMGAAALAGVRVGYVKVHGALANLAADERGVADAIARAVAAISRDLAVLAISGTAQEAAARTVGLPCYSEVFADRAYLPDGRLVPRGVQGAVIEDAEHAAERLIGFLDSGRMPVLGGGRVALVAHSVCVHGDTPHALAMARRIREKLTAAGVTLAPFLAPA